MSPQPQFDCHLWPDPQYFKERENQAANCPQKCQIIYTFSAEISIWTDVQGRTFLFSLIFFFFFFFFSGFSFFMLLDFCLVLVFCFYLVLVPTVTVPYLGPVHNHLWPHWYSWDRCTTICGPTGTPGTGAQPFVAPLVLLGPVHNHLWPHWYSCFVFLRFGAHLGFPQLQLFTGQSHM